MRTHGKRIALLLAALAVVASYAVYNVHHVEALEAGLADAVNPEVEELLGMDCAVRLVGVDTTAARRYGLFGEPMGKVSVYVVTRSAEADQYVVYDYFYKREEGRWVFSESGVCLHGHDFERARELDIAHGYPGLDPVPVEPVAQLPAWKRHPVIKFDEHRSNEE